MAQVTDLDSRLYRSLRTLVLKPGQLTTDHSHGRRRPYLGPLQLFLIANLVYFLVQPFSPYTGYNTPLESHLSRQVYSEFLPVAAWVEAEVSRTRLSPEAFEAVFNSRTELLARSLAIVMVPMFALFLGMLMASRRRPAVDHLVFALHYFAFELLVLHCALLLIWPDVVRGLFSGLLWITGAAPPGPGWLKNAADGALEIGAHLLVVVPYLYLAYRRFYSVGALRSAASAVLSIAALLTVIISYRLILLLLTLGSLR